MYVFELANKRKSNHPFAKRWIFFFFFAMLQHPTVSQSRSMVNKEFILKQIFFKFGQLFKNTNLPNSRNPIVSRNLATCYYIFPNSTIYILKAVLFRSMPKVFRKALQIFKSLTCYFRLSHFQQNVIKSSLKNTNLPNSRNPFVSRNLATVLLYFPKQHHLYL